MALPGRKPVIAHVVSISVECADCGRNRWWKPDELRRFGVTDGTPLAELSGRIVCSACRADGLPGTAVSIQAAFVDERQRVRSEAQMLSEREVLVEARRA
ncbi:hypothetical protein EB230_14315 [Mesorhizobium sp. NZP2234]|uniref:hypothetical protein n=1 Tax=Mesorhizobium sp. NZP2234 TaxID=2483402 RepID=UPI00155296BA|nr:hypothetical protein [Mesorhizobium sp. NZP2234]QKC89463.1 hypothetical protein EB230_14315 [Mesorhizobium sp. NZP2234]